MTEAVLDSSAILASLNGEPGGDAIASLLAQSFVSSINLAEVVSKLIGAGMSQTEAALATSQFGCQFVDTDEKQAIMAGVIHAGTRRVGISMADAFCLALAKARGCPAVTANRIWKQLSVGVEIRLIR
jgi:PIN domain nuclease of toxin-antitoxin system